MPGNLAVLLGGVRQKFQQSFLTSGTFTPSAALLAAGGRVRIRYIVGGGGGGGTTSGGGGGGGQVLKDIVVIVTGPVTVTVGAGGAIATAGTNSTFGALATALAGQPGATGATASGGDSPRGGRGSFGTGGGTLANTGGQGGPGIDGFGIGGGGSASGTNAGGGGGGAGGGGLGPIPAGLAQNGRGGVQVDNTGNGGDVNQPGRSGRIDIEWDE